MTVTVPVTVTVTVTVIVTVPVTRFMKATSSGLTVAAHCRTSKIAS